MLKVLKRTGIFPFIPIVPIAMIASSMVMSAISLIEVRELSRAVGAPAV